MNFVDELNKLQPAKRTAPEHECEDDFVEKVIAQIKLRSTNIAKAGGKRKIEGYFQIAHGEYYCETAAFWEGDIQKAMAPAKKGIYQTIQTHPPKCEGLSVHNRLDYKEDEQYIILRLKLALERMGFQNIKLKVFHPDLLDHEIKTRWIFGHKNVFSRDYVKISSYFSRLYVNVEW